MPFPYLFCGTFFEVWIGLVFLGCEAKFWVLEAKSIGQQWDKYLYSLVAFCILLYFVVQGECSGVVVFIDINIFSYQYLFHFPKVLPKKNSNGRSHFSDKRQSISRHDAIAMYWIRETKTVWHYMALSLKGRPHQNEICFCFPNTNKQSSINP